MMGGTPSSRVLCHWWTVVAFVVPFLSTLSVGMVMKYQTYEEDALFTVIGNLAKDMSLNPSDDAKTNFKMMKQFSIHF